MSDDLRTAREDITRATEHLSDEELGAQVDTIVANVRSGVTFRDSAEVTSTEWEVAP